jgi:4'-phosphopantetheinyl transferase
VKVTEDAGLPLAVWRAQADGGAPAPHALSVLDARERERAGRFLHERDRRRFVASHAFMRSVLARYLDIEPAAVRIEPGRSGKPAALTTAGGAELRWNAAHAGDLTVVAVARGAGFEVGVDVEEIRELPRLDAVAALVCAPAEVEAIWRLPAGARLEAFLRCWVRKEAVVKATGDGLRRPLARLEVSTGIGPPRVLRIDGRPDRSWRLLDLPPIPGFVGALAVRAPRPSAPPRPSAGPAPGPGHPPAGSGG